MKYLNIDERPPIKPHRNEAIAYFYRGYSYSMTENGEVTFTFPEEEKIDIENFSHPSKEEIDFVHERMLEEWEEYEIVLKKRNCILIHTAQSILNLYQDIESEKIPGKDGLFFQYLTEKLNSIE